MSAQISSDGLYRYALTRYLGSGTRPAVFIMLNPSTADATTDDPTIRRCVGFTKAWGLDRMIALNLFAFRATKIEDMKDADDPVGPECDEWLRRYLDYPIKYKAPIVCAWGVHGSFRGRHLEVLRLIEEMGGQPMALRVTKDKHPSHPLYLPKNLKPVLYEHRPLSYHNRINVK